MRNHHIRRYYPPSDRTVICIDCGSPLVVRENWNESSARHHNRICKSCDVKKAMKSYINHREERLFKAIKLRERQRHEVLVHYSKTPIPSCACCGETIEAFLTLSHPNNDGNEHRRMIARKMHLSEGRGVPLVTWLIQNKFPEDGYRIIVECFNCNCGRKRNGICPHRRIQSQ
jgi:hypothetical protein